MEKTFAPEIAKIVAAIERDDDTFALFDELAEKWGAVQANAIWQAGCDSYDDKHQLNEDDEE